jgi:small subunit ribosomal protein S9
MERKFIGTGRRKSSVAKVEMIPGKGKVIINGKTLEEYFPNKVLIMTLMSPLVATNTEKNFDITIKAIGGGYTGQSEAARLGIARALLEYDEPNVETEDSFRLVLKRLGFITRDSRAKERKKPGLKAARRAPQFSKR